MIEVTKQAAEYLAAMRSEHDLGTNSGVRFVPNGSGIGITLTTTPEPGDKVVMAPGIPVYVAAAVAARIDGSTIDAADRDGKTKLVVRATQSATSPA
jgi:Fe-S cluster assembly iron-binding protein IscA